MDIDTTLQPAGGAAPPRPPHLRVGLDQERQAAGRLEDLVDQAGGDGQPGLGEHLVDLVLVEAGERDRAAGVVPHRLAASPSAGAG